MILWHKTDNLHLWNIFGRSGEYRVCGIVLYRKIKGKMNIIILYIVWRQLIHPSHPPTFDKVVTAVLAPTNLHNYNRVTYTILCRLFSVLNITQVCRGTNRIYLIYVYNKILYRSVLIYDSIKIIILFYAVVMTLSVSGGLTVKYCFRLARELGSLSRQYYWARG